MDNFKTRNGFFMTHSYRRDNCNASSWGSIASSVRALMCVAVVACFLLTLSFTSSDALGEGRAAVKADKQQVLGLKEILSQRPKLLPAAAKRTVVNLTLLDCIKKAMEHNYSLRISSVDPSIRHSELIEAEAVFDTVFYGSAQFAMTDRDNIDSGYYTRNVIVNGRGKNKHIATSPYTNQSDHTYALGLRQRLSTGAVVQLSQQMRRYEDDNTDSSFRNPFYEFGVQLQVSQPLLRDFGVDVNKASIRAAKKQYEISRQAFQLEVIRTIAAVETAYWELFFARQRVKVNTQLLDRATRTYRMVQARKDLDTQSLANSRTRAQIARTQADLVAAHKNVYQKQELLLENINDPKMPLTGKWEIITSDRPNNPELKVEYQHAVDTAMQLRPEIIAQRYGEEIAQLVVDVAKNQLLPRFDVVYQTDFSGAGTNPDQAWNKHLQRDLVSHTIGLSWEMPISNRGNEAAYFRAKTQKQQEMLRLKSIKEQILADVNISIHDLNMTNNEIDVRHKSMDADRDTVLYYLATIDAELQNTMTPTSLNLKLNADESLARSQIATILTMVQYELAIMNMHRSQGTLLRYNNIKLDEGEK